MEKHPFRRCWAIVGFSVVYGREERLESNGFRGGEKGHRRGKGGVVVVIEQVALRKIGV